MPVRLNIKLYAIRIYSAAEHRDSKQCDVYQVHFTDECHIRILQLIFSDMDERKTQYNNILVLVR